MKIKTKAMMRIFLLLTILIVFLYLRMEKISREGSMPKPPEKGTLYEIMPDKNTR